MRTAAPLSDRSLRILLAVVVLAARAPCAGYFNFVTFDGTFYLNQARALLHGSLSGGAFPIGYPLLVAPVLAVVRDAVVAGMVVSVLAALGSVLLFYDLGKRLAGRTDAFIGAVVLATAPLFIQTSLLTLSESAYVCWVMLALALFGRERFAPAGLAIGMAAATRPEAIAVAGTLGLMLVVRTVRRRAPAPRAVAGFAACFLAVYAVNIAAMSVPRGGLTLLSRSGAFESKATPWMLRESLAEFEGRESIEAVAREQSTHLDRTAEYARRLPRDVMQLFKQTLPFLPLFALLSRRATFVLAAFAPILFIPLFTEDRGILRWMVPYLPPLILCGVMGVAAIARPRLRALARATVVLAALVAFLLNRGVLRSGIEDEMRPVRAAAAQFRDRVSSGDRIADRKPYFAFYAGGRYTEIPIGPYGETVGQLAADGVRFLSLFQPSVHNLRPAMRPLLYDLAAIRGELRYRQVYFDRSGQVVYQRALDADPLTTRLLTDTTSTTLAPAWSPDGTRVAFRRFVDGRGEVCVIDAAGGDVRVLAAPGRIADFLSWSPDGARVALSVVEDENQDLAAIDVQTGRIERLTREPARDYAPSWCRATGEIVFGSDRGGAPGVWLMRPGAAPSKLSGDAPAGPPSLSPRGDTVAWLDGAGRLALLDRASGQQVVVAEPRGILAPAAWHPEGDVVAVAAYDWGVASIYLIRVSDGRALRLTSTLRGKSMPSWRPDGSEIVVASGERNDVALIVLGTLAPYLGRLYEDVEVNAFQRPDDTRGEPPRPR
jgi:Tol biopolymer transport system component